NKKNKKEGKIKMKILVFTTHNDDEVLGVGGTIAKYVENGHDVYVCEVTSGKDQKRLANIKNEALSAHKVLGVKETFFLELPVVGLADIPTKELNTAVHNLVQKIHPDITFIPHMVDIHLDHHMMTVTSIV